MPREGHFLESSIERSLGLLSFKFLHFISKYLNAQFRASPVAALEIASACLGLARENVGTDEGGSLYTLVL